MRCGGPVRIRRMGLGAVWCSVPPMPTCVCVCVGGGSRARACVGRVILHQFPRRVSVPGRPALQTSRRPPAPPRPTPNRNAPEDQGREPCKLVLGRNHTALRMRTPCQRRTQGSSSGKRRGASKHGAPAANLFCMSPAERRGRRPVKVGVQSLKSMGCGSIGRCFDDDTMSRQWPRLAGGHRARIAWSRRPSHATPHGRHRREAGRPQRCPIGALRAVPIACVWPAGWLTQKRIAPQDATPREPIRSLRYTALPCVPRRKGRDLGWACVGVKAPLHGDLGNQVPCGHKDHPAHRCHSTCIGPSFSRKPATPIDSGSVGATANNERLVCARLVKRRKGVPTAPPSVRTPELRISNQARRTAPPREKTG